jgi:hypothetical protein
LIQVPTAGGGMGASYAEFQDCVSKMVYHHFPFEADLDHELQGAITRYGAHKAALGLLRSLWEDRQKVCRTYVRHHHTLGHVATVIAESKNSSLKRKGQRNQEMKKYTMGELSRMVLGWETKLDLDAADI